MIAASENLKWIRQSIAQGIILFDTHDQIFNQTNVSMFIVFRSQVRGMLQRSLSIGNEVLGFCSNLQFIDME